MAASRAKQKPPAEPVFDLDDVETTYVLRFDDPKYENLIVKCREAGTGQLIDLMSADVDNLTPESIGPMIDLFAESLASWNIRRGGKPLPASAEGLRSLGITMTMTIVEAWASASMGVSGPLGTGSSSGDTSEVVSLPMAEL